MSEKPKRIDWEAVLRDYRTGKFTLRELETMHGVSYAQISRKSKAEKWTKDLREVIRHATNVALLRETVTKAQQDSTDTVSAAVQENTRVILSHRKRLTALSQAADDAMETLMSLRGTVREVKDDASLVGAVTTLTTATKNIIDKERQAYGIDDPEKTKADSFEDLLNAITNGRTEA